MKEYEVRHKLLPGHHRPELDVVGLAEETARNILAEGIAAMIRKGEIGKTEKFNLEGDIVLFRVSVTI